jgi:hypothetical protein
MKKGLLLTALMYREDTIYKQALKKLTDKFGEIETEGPPYNFNFTDYYFKEMGQPLLKRLVVFKEPINRDELVKIKLYTIKVERELSVEGRRKVNIDPGYITKANLVLATTKEFPHRIYLGSGIFGEVTLTFKKDGCSYFDWTYPDFKTPEVCEFLQKIRKKIKVNTKKL